MFQSSFNMLNIKILPKKKKKPSHFREIVYFCVNCRYLPYAKLYGIICMDTGFNQQKELQAIVLQPLSVELPHIDVTLRCVCYSSSTSVTVIFSLRPTPASWAWEIPIHLIFVRDQKTQMRRHQTKIRIEANIIRCMNSNFKHSYVLRMVIHRQFRTFKRPMDTLEFVLIPWR